jgi:protoheme IX farnesyltransferase
MMAAGTESCVSPATAIPAAGSASLPGAILLLTKPGIVLAETAAGFAGILLASRGLPTSATIVFWCLLSLIMAASGAAMANCVLEADADRKMTRLAARSRALATVGKDRVLTIALFLMGGAFILTGIFLNFPTLLLLTAACGSYLILYTRWLKCSPWGVLAGAIPGALPPLIGAAAVTGSVPAFPLLLGCVIFVWQFPHFWFLALQYSDQYRQAGIPVLPLTHGIKTTKRLTLLCSAALLPATLSFKLLASCSPGFTSAVLLAGTLFPLLCHRFLRTGEYRKGFIVSLAYLAVIFMALITETILTIGY